MQYIRKKNKSTSNEKISFIEKAWNGSVFYKHSKILHTTAGALQTTGFSCNEGYLAAYILCIKIS